MDSIVDDSDVELEGLLPEEISEEAERVRLYDYYEKGGRDLIVG